MPQDQLSSFFTAVVFKSGINRYNRKDGGKEMNRVMDTDELKKRWNEMDEEARIRMICMLYQRSADAGRMIDAELLGSVYPRRLFERARKQLHRCFFPEDEIRGFSLNYAKEIVTAFQEQCDDPGLIAELKLCFAQYAVQLDHQAGGPASFMSGIMRSRPGCMKRPLLPLRRTGRSFSGCARSWNR